MRKAAVRETTGPLKSWLHEHRKNPYPTKAEKIMLAIITQMTLTQVRLLVKGVSSHKPWEEDDDEEDCEISEDTMKIRW